MFWPSSGTTTSSGFIANGYVPNYLCTTPLSCLSSCLKVFGCDYTNAPIPLGSLFRLNVSWVPLSIRRPHFQSRPSDDPLQSPWLFRPSHASSSSVVPSAYAVSPCLHHGCLFLDPPSYPVSYDQTFNSGLRATHCATFAILRPMYVASEWIPIARSTSLSAIISHDPFTCRLARFPII